MNNIKHHSCFNNNDMILKTRQNKIKMEFYCLDDKGKNLLFSLQISDGKI